MLSVLQFSCLGMRPCILFSGVLSFLDISVLKNVVFSSRYMFVRFQSPPWYFLDTTTHPSHLLFLILLLKFIYTSTVASLPCSLQSVFLVASLYSIVLLHLPNHLNVSVCSICYYSVHVVHPMWLQSCSSVHVIAPIYFNHSRNVMYSAIKHYVNMAL